MSDNANRHRQLAGGVSDNANRHRQLAGGASDNANRERQLAAGALYGYCIKTYKLFFLSNFTAPNAKFMPRRVDKLMDNVSERSAASDNAN